MLTRAGPGELTIWFEDQPIPARDSDSVAAALLAAGIIATRSTAVSGALRGPFCMMGACFDCLAEVDGRANVQTCMTHVREGMQVRRQKGARAIAAAD
jgi:predicted molibdopterin-dependent oxidoreductase YjgC